MHADQEEDSEQDSDDDEGGEGDEGEGPEEEEGDTEKADRPGSGKGGIRASSKVEFGEVMEDEQGLLDLRNWSQCGLCGEPVDKNWDRCPNCGQAT